MDAISYIDSSKASGPDSVSPRLLKEGINELSRPLARLFNKLISSSIFPQSWKLANVTPIYKKSNPSDPTNYRPISLLSCIGKLMERCIHKHLYNYLSDNNILSQYQSGFIRGDSTTNQLIYIYNDICQALDAGKEVRVVFCDISKAFDRVWHKGLLAKLSSIGISGSLLNWFSSYLSSRKQRVVLRNSNSDWKDINAGVPQGSILGPLLFLIYINDIVEEINSNIRLFADDTSLYIVVDDPNTASRMLNDDLIKIHNWSKRWLVDFNPSKTETLLISRKNTRVVHPPLLMNNNVIQQVDTHKHLGVTFTNNAKWHPHISSIITRSWQRIGMLRALKFTINRVSLEKAYFTFIRPLLEYSDSVWDNCTVELKNELQSIQNEAARITTGGTKLCSIDKLNAETKWESLDSRRRKHKLILFYKMKTNITPAYLSNLIPDQTQHRYRLRNDADIPLIHARTNLYQTRFYHQLSGSGTRYRQT